MIIRKVDGTEIKRVCVMCESREAEYIATETNEDLCETCARINEGIKEMYYPEKKNLFPPREIKNEN